MKNLKLILENPNTQTEIVLGFVADEDEANEVVDCIEEKWFSLIDSNLDKPVDTLTDDPVLLYWEGSDIYYINSYNEHFYL
jgi:hypothetical protein